MDCNKSGMNRNNYRTDDFKALEGYLPFEKFNPGKA